MRKLILYILFLSVSISLNAQSNGFSLEFGGSLTKFNYNDLDDNQFCYYRPNFGLQLSGFYTINRFSVGVGIGLRQENAIIFDKEVLDEFGHFAYERGENYKLNHLIFTPSLRYNLINKEKVRVLLDCRYEYGTIVNEAIEYYLVDYIPDEIYNTQSALLSSIFEIPITEKLFLNHILGVGYRFINPYKEDNSEISSLPNNFMGSHCYFFNLQVGCGYRF